MVLVQEIIRKKRDGKALDTAEIQAFIDGMMNGSVTQEQIAAFTMAVFFSSMEHHEIADLTTSMTASGETLDWRSRGIEALVVDKHSTGGVGDKVSLVLAPLVAAAGGYVPMISGRALGHTGGTLDKLDSIQDFQSQISVEKFQDIVAKTGCAIVGANERVAPADKRMYAVRDVTATVESIALITASILSKKAASGLSGLVMDIKAGSGAFMPTISSARELGASIARVAATLKLPTKVVITDMSEVLGTTAGNAVEVLEVVEYLTNTARDPRLHEVVMVLATQMLLLIGLADSRQDAEQKLNNALDGGYAAEKFSSMIQAQGGPADFLDRSQRYVSLGSVTQAIFPHAGGYIQAVDGQSLGNLIVGLGGGRRQVGDVLDYGVGFEQVRGVGTYVDSHAPLLLIRANSREDIKAIEESIVASFQISDIPVQVGSAICEGA